MKKYLAAENDLLPIALARFIEITGIEGRLKPATRDNDTRIVLKKTDNNDQVELQVEARRAIGAAATMEKSQKPQHILATNYVNPLEADRLQKLGIQFIDCAGNAFIDQKNLFVYIKGNKPENKYAVKPARLFKPGGMRIIFTLLCKTDLINAPYRDLAAGAGVALGTVAWVMQDLREQGYLLEIGHKIRKLVARKNLLKTWLTGYEQLLRPKLIVNRYHAENPDWWRGAEIEGGLWGAEIAAEKLTGYLKPQIVTLYAERMPDRLVLKHRLRLDPKGEIEVVAPFWNFDYPEEKEGLVPPLAVYADLMLRGEGRTTETAGIVYDKYLARYFEEN